MLKHQVDYYDKEKTKIYRECWRLNGLYHREDGPAFIKYYEDGSVESEYYYLKGKRHREGGPAFIKYNQDGSLNYKRYYLINAQYTEEEWLYLIPKEEVIFETELIFEF